MCYHTYSLIQMSIVMDEFEMLHGLRKMVEGIEARFEEYTKKMIYS